MKTVNNPNLTREDVDHLLLTHLETITRHKEAVKLKSKVAASQQVLKNHLDDLKLKGVKT